MAAAAPIVVRAGRAPCGKRRRVRRRVVTGGGARLWTGEHEVYRHAVAARQAFGGGACTLLVIGTNKRVLLLFEGATACAAGMDRQLAADLVGCLATAAEVNGRDGGEGRR